MSISRRNAIHVATLAALSAGLGATTLQDAAADDGLGDYELTIMVSFDFQHLSAPRLNGLTPATYGAFAVEGGRVDGVHRLRVYPVLTGFDDGDLHLGPALVDVRDQTEGPDAVALLQSLLGGHAVLDGSMAQ